MKNQLSAEAGNCGQEWAESFAGEASILEEDYSVSRLFIVWNVIRRQQLFCFKIARDIKIYSENNI
jgi:hypothetical protein